MTSLFSWHRHSPNHAKKSSRTTTPAVIITYHCEPPCPPLQHVSLRIDLQGYVIPYVALSHETTSIAISNCAFYPRDHAGDDSLRPVGAFGTMQRQLTAYSSIRVAVCALWCVCVSCSWRARIESDPLCATALALIDTVQLITVFTGTGGEYTSHHIALKCDHRSASKARAPSTAHTKGDDGVRDVLSAAWWANRSLFLPLAEPITRLRFASSSVSVYI